MVGQMTYSGVTGPAISVTAAVYPNLQRVEFDYQHEVIKVTYDQPEKTVVLDMRASSTISFAISAGISANITVS